MNDHHRRINVYYKTHATKKQHEEIAKRESIYDMTYLFKISIHNIYGYLYIPWIFVSDVCLMNWIRLISTIPTNENIIMAIIEPSITMNQVCVRISSAMLWFIGCLGILRSANVRMCTFNGRGNRERKKKTKQKPYKIFLFLMPYTQSAIYYYCLCVG